MRMTRHQAQPYEQAGYAIRLGEWQDSPRNVSVRCAVSQSGKSAVGSCRTLGLPEPSSRDAARDRRLERESGLDRQRKIARPLVPGAEVEPGVVDACLFESHQCIGSACPFEAVEDHRRLLRDADACTFREDFIV